MLKGKVWCTKSKVLWYIEQYWEIADPAPTLPYLNSSKHCDNRYLFQLNLLLLVVLIRIC